MKKFVEKLSLTEPPKLRNYAEELVKANYVNQVEIVDGFEGDDALVSQIVLSTVVVFYSEDIDLVANLLAALRHQTSVSHELILVDNSEGRATPELVEFADVYIRLTKNLGAGAGRNVGSLYARGQYLNFIDGDASIADGYLSIIMELIDQKPDLVGFRGAVIADDGDTPPHYCPSREVIPSLIDTEGNSVISRDKFLAVGGFEDDLLGSEGPIMCYRMIEFLGIRKDAFAYFPDMVIRHKWSAASEKIARKVWNKRCLDYHCQYLLPDYASILKYYSQFRDRSSYYRVPSKSNVVRFAADARFSKEAQAFESSREQKLMSNKQLNFSVVITNYNYGEFLVAAIESVQKQILKNVEIIVVDDCSDQPETLQILFDVERIEGVTLIRKSINEGVAAARNDGVREAKAPYVLCLDADDKISKHYLDAAFRRFEAYPNVGVVSCYVKAFGDESWVWHPDPEASTFPRILVNSPVPISSCYRKSIFEDVGGYNDKQRGYEDWDFWISIKKRGWDFKVIDDYHFFYYRHKKSKVHKSNKLASKYISQIVERHRELYEEHFVSVLSLKHAKFIELSNELKLRATESSGDNAGSEQALVLSRKVRLRGYVVRVSRLLPKGLRSNELLRKFVKFFF